MSTPMSTSTSANDPQLSEPVAAGSDAWRRETLRALEKLLDVAGTTTPWVEIVEARTGSPKWTRARFRNRGRRAGLGHGLSARQLNALLYRVERAIAQAYDEGAAGDQASLPRAALGPWADGGGSGHPPEDR